jgi:hypothetical protein
MKLSIITITLNHYFVEFSQDLTLDETIALSMKEFYEKLVHQTHSAQIVSFYGPLAYFDYDNLVFVKLPAQAPGSIFEDESAGD